MSKKVLGSLGLAVALISSAPALALADSLPKGVEKVTTVEGITEYKLGNGLEVLLFPDPSKENTTVNVTYLVGSRNENYGETGMAHLLEHMLFKGSTHHTNIPQELTEHGARPNGSTYFDRTNYFETFAATDANLQWALDLESDRMVNSFVAKKDLDSEMTVVRNEFEVDENQPFRVLRERLLSTAYLWHHYGNSTIGARSDVENVPIDRLQAFYKRYYQPDNAVLTVAGKFDEGKTLGLIAAKFGAIPKPTRVIEKTYTTEPTQDGERSVTLRRVGDVQVVAIGYHVPAGSSPEFPAIDLMGYALGDSPSGRLYKALVETKKATNVAYDTMQLREPGMAGFYAVLDKGQNLDEAKQILTKVVEDEAKNPPTQEEIDRGRQAILKQMDLTLRSSERFGLDLSEWIAMGDWRLFFLYRDELKATTKDQVAAAAAHYLKPSNRTTAEFIPTEHPDRAEIPPTPDVASLVKDYHGGKAIAQGEAFDPSTENVEKRTHRATVGALKAAFVPKKTRGETVYLNLTVRFGDEKSLFGKDAVANLTGSMLSRGSKHHTRQQLRDEADKLGSRISVDGGAQTAFISIESTRENLPAALKLAAEELKEPTFPAAELETLRAEQINGIEQQKSDPQAKAQTALQRHISPYPKGDIRYVATPDEEIADLKAVTLDQVKAFHKQFYGASHGELAVVGDFDEKAITKLAKSLFGGWKSHTSYTRVPSVYTSVTAVNETIETPDKTSAVWFSGERFPMRDDDADYPALVLGNYMLGGGFLNSRLATRIRQHDGLSYGVGSFLSANSLDKDAIWGTYAIYAPQNLKKLEVAFNEEIARALDKGFTDDEIKAAKDGWLQSRNVSRANDGELVRSEASHLYIDRTFKWDGDFEAKVAKLTGAQILDAMKKHLDWSKQAIYKAGDFAGAAKKSAANGPESGKGGGAAPTTNAR